MNSPTIQQLQNPDYTYKDQQLYSFKGRKVWIISSSPTHGGMELGIYPSGNIMYTSYSNWVNGLFTLTTKTEKL